MCSSGNGFSPDDGKGEKGIFGFGKMPFAPFPCEKRVYAEHGPSERESLISNVQMRVFPWV